MSEFVLAGRDRLVASLLPTLRKESVWLVSATILTILFLVAPSQGAVSAGFVARNLAHVAPYLVLSIGLAAYAGATGADGLIARAFTGSPITMIVLAAAAGGLSPFCSCGVIPLIAALLAMGVPLSAVMAFWLASPVMDPSMFVLTTGVMGVEFAVAKTLAAIGLGVAGGFTVLLLAHNGNLLEPLRAGVGNGGCGGSKVRTAKPVVWRFWGERARIDKFLTGGLKSALFLAKWLTLAFILESLLLAFVPAELITRALGGAGLLPIVAATLVGVPAYFNGYAALPLVAGLVDQGMAPGAAMAFLVAGGVTSVPAAIAVWALVRPRVFALYLGLALSGSFAAGVLFQLWHAAGALT